MEARKIKLLEFIGNGKKTFNIPVYQRNYDWKEEQCRKLFEDIQNIVKSDYEIEHFLGTVVFVSSKSEMNFNEYVLIDGQQRITSINIALRGTYRFFYRKWRITRLYLNLLWDKGDDNPEEMTYQFLFKENNQILPRTDYPQLWYRVGDILNYDDAEDAKDSIENDLNGFDEDTKKRARKMISKLFSVVNVTQNINYYEEKSDDYDKVLEIFIRTNTGGQKLEYSDILLSTATAKWRNLNAREEINKFTDEINKIGNGYNFGKDFVMKGAMYLTENLPIQYKISSFTRKNLECIEDHWEETKDAISNSIQLISKYGFTDKNLVARLTLLPVAQYLQRKSKGYLTSSHIKDVDQNNIQKWIIMMLLKGALGSATDNKLNLMRPVVRAVSEYFPYAEISKELKTEMTFNDMEIENLLQYNYGTRYSYLILSLLYPGRDWKDKKYNEDHIFPQNEFKIKNLRARGYDDATIQKYTNCFNTILNLELLDDSENKSKNAKPFDIWLKSRDTNFKKRHHIPEMNDYSLDFFLEFIQKRKELLTKQIKEFYLQ